MLLDAERAQAAGDEAGDGALARARQAREPECESLVIHESGTLA